MVLRRRLPIALLLAAGLQGCDEAPQAPLASPGPARAAAILQRLDQDPLAAPTGTRFIATTPGESEKGPVLPRFSGERHRNGPYGRNQLGASLALDLSGLDIPRLLGRANEIAPGQMDGPAKAGAVGLRRWEDLLAAPKQDGEALLLHVTRATALHFADAYSGLGLGMVLLSARSGPTDCALTYALADPEGANVILLNVWIGLPHAKAFVSLSYVAHFNGPPPASFPPAAAWGTRKN